MDVLLGTSTLLVTWRTHCTTVTVTCHHVTLPPPRQMVTRRVRVYQPAKNAMQSGTHKYHNWVLDFDTQERWENPLMGWAST